VPGRAGHGPLIVAHRGSSHDTAEHTLTAYEKALRDGADGLECDVRLTRDGHLVCVHDRRLERTSDGRGPVSARRLQELEVLDFAAWKNDLPDTADELVMPDFGDAYAPDLTSTEGRRVLTLERLLESVISVGRPVRLFVETKHPTRWGAEVERRLVELFRRFGALGRTPDDGWSVLMMSESPLAVRRFKLMTSQVPTVLVLDRRLPNRHRGVGMPFGVDIPGPGVHLLRMRPDYVELVHRAGQSVYSWTVDDLDDIDYLAGLGVDMIATNRPDAVRAHLAAGLPAAPADSSLPRTL
jgi:glycerophosphoryl diester phosphodiesterase